MILNQAGVKEPGAQAPEIKRGNVSVHIERLVLDGLPLAAGGAAQLQIAVQSELTRLLTEDGLNSASSGALRSVTAPGFHITGDSAPADLGKQIARNVYESLNRST